MSRLPAIAPDALDEEQARVLDEMLAGPRGQSGFLTRERPIGGPFAPWLRSPRMAGLAQSLGAFLRYGTSLDPRLSEIAIIVVGQVWQAGYEFAAHGPMAIRAGVSEEVVRAIARGDTPVFEREDERIVYEFARMLILQRSVDEAQYRVALELLGEAGVVELVGILGYYTLVCMTLNTFEVPLAEGMEWPFPTPPFVKGSVGA